MPSTLARSACASLHRALGIFRVVFISGPRQTGKTTLVRQAGGDRRFVTLDNLSMLASARSDPHTFIDSLPVPVTIDEVQRAPDLLLAVKQRVDEQAAPGAYLLTGSADPQAIATVRETLAGRMAMIPLLPLTWAERRGRPDWNPLDLMAEAESVRDVVAALGTGEPTSLGVEVLQGGFPEPVLHLPDPAARLAWHEQYIATYLERDVPAFVQVDQVATFLRFVRLAASSTAQILNASRLGRDLGVSHDTVRRWLSVLKSTYVGDQLEPYWRNVRKRLTKSPKLHLTDSGLAAALLGIDDWQQAERLNLAGPLTETWVHQHLRAFAATAARRTTLHHFRSHSGDECDFVVESARRLLPIEVKAARTPTPKDAAGLRTFLDLFPDEAPFGLLLHAGPEVVPLADRVLAVPLSLFLAGPDDGERP